MQFGPLPPGSNAPDPGFLRSGEKVGWSRSPTVARVQAGHSPQPRWVPQKAWSCLARRRRGPTMVPPLQPQYCYIPPHGPHSTTLAPHKRPSTSGQTNTQTRPRLGRAALCPMDITATLFTNLPPTAMASLSPCPRASSKSFRPPAPPHVLSNVGKATVDAAAAADVGQCPLSPSTHWPP